MKKHLPPLAVWTGMCLLFFGTVLLGIERLPNSDLSGQFLSFAQFQAESLANGRFPIWSPGSHAGFPFAADTQAAVFYLPRLITILLSLPWGFSYHVLQIEGIAHIWLAGAFTYLLAYDITKERWASLIAALAFGLGAYLTSYPLLQLALLETITWLPLVLLLLRKGVAHGERPLPWFIAAGIVLALAAFAGHPQTLLHVGYMAAIYYLYLTIRARWQWHWILALGGIMGLTVVGLTAIFWLPTLNYLQLTTRSEVTYEFVAKGQPLINYIELLTPLTHAVWSPEFVGVTTLILALFVLFGSKKFASQPEHSEILFWGVMALLAAWVSLGDKGVLFAAVYRLAPGFSLFRQQERLVGIVSLSMALLAAQGFALWLRLTVSDRRTILKYVSLTMFLLLVLTGLTLAMASAVVNPNWPLSWTGALIATVLTLALLFLNGRSRLVTALLIALLAVQLYIPSRPILNLQAGSPNVFWPQPAWLNQIQGDAPFRIDTQGLFHLNFGEAYHLEDIDGISPLEPLAVTRMRQLPAPLRWQLLNVVYVTARAHADPSLTQLAEFTESLIPGEESPGQLYRFEDAFPRAWMTYEPLIATDTDSAFAMLQDPAFNPATQVILQTETPPVSSPDSPPTVVVERPYPEKTIIHATTATPGILVISEWAMPGWSVLVDNQPADMLTVNSAFQGVYLPAGEHVVTVTYTLPGLQTGALLSLLSLLAVLLIAWKWQPVVTFAAQREPAQERPSPVLPTLSTQQWRWLLLGIILLGCVLRIYHSGTQELRGDEAFSYLFASVPLGEIIPRLIREGDPHSPFHYLLLHGWMRLAGDSELAMRTLSWIPGLLLIPLLAQLGRRIGGRPLGLLAAFFTAVSPSLIWVSQDVRNQYTLTLFFATAATLLLAKLTDPDRPYTRQLLGWLAYILLCALTVYSHYFGAIILLGHGVYLLVQSSRRRWLLPWLVAGAWALLLFLPWATAVFRNLLAAGQLSDPANPELAAYLTTVGIESIAGQSLSTLWLRWAFVGALALCLYGFNKLRRTQPAWAYALLTWLLTTTLLIYLVQFRRSTFNAFYITVAAPAWWLLLSYGLLALWQSSKKWQRVTAVLSTLILAGIAFLSLVNYITDPAESRSQGYREMAAQIEAEFAAGDLFVAHAPNPSLVYYLRHIPIEYQMQPANFQEEPGQTMDTLSNLAAAHERLWFVPAGSYWDHAEVVHPWLQFQTVEESRTQHDELTLYSYRPTHAAETIWRPINQQLPNGAVLDGAYMTVNGVPAALDTLTAVPVGAEVDVTLIWHTEQPIDTSFTVFVHLLAEDGFLLTQHDGIPVRGTLPTPLWLPGERYVDVHTFTMPSTPNGQLTVGIYDSNTVERQLFPDGQDKLLIGQLRSDE